MLTSGGNTNWAAPEINQIWSQFFFPPQLLKTTSSRGALRTFAENSSPHRSPLARERIYNFRYLKDTNLATWGWLTVPHRWFSSYHLKSNHPNSMQVPVAIHQFFHTATNWGFLHWFHIDTRCLSTCWRFRSSQARSEEDNKTKDDKNQRYQQNEASLHQTSQKSSSINTKWRINKHQGQKPGSRFGLKNRS